MKKNNSMDELNKKIFLAVTKYAIELRGTHKISKVLAEMIGQTEKTASNRMDYGSWSFDEVKAVARVTQDTDLKTFIKQQF